MTSNKTHPVDPFSLKSIPKWNPRRALPTLVFRVQDLWSRIFFGSYAMPMVPPEEAEEIIPSPAPGETAVTDEQRKVFAACLKTTEHLVEPCVEVGSYRGQTTKFFAERTKRNIIAIDPFFEVNGFPRHRQEFLKNTSSFPHVKLLRHTSGEGAKQIERVSFCFIDAAHDYANVRFDVSVYAPKVVTGGVLCFHDTDNIRFAAGTRRAVCEFVRSTTDFELIYHVENLVALRRK